MIGFHFLIHLRTFLVSMFEAYSNIELKVTYMCFECSMTGKRCENCHYLCISDVPDIPLNYAIEISFCYEDGVKVNLFFKKVYERKSLVWRCWMRKSPGGGVPGSFSYRYVPTWCSNPTLSKIFRNTKILPCLKYQH